MAITFKLEPNMQIPSELATASSSHRLRKSSSKANSGREAPKVIPHSLRVEITADGTCCLNILPNQKVALPFVGDTSTVPQSFSLEVGLLAFRDQGGRLQVLNCTQRKITLMGNEEYSIGDRFDREERQETPSPRSLPASTEDDFPSRASDGAASRTQSPSQMCWRVSDWEEPCEFSLDPDVWPSPDEVRARKCV